jgi:hypothetical protein
MNDSGDRASVLLSAPLDCWVALSEDETRIVAVGDTFAEVVEKAHQEGVTDPIIIKTPEDWTPRVL